MSNTIAFGEWKLGVGNTAMVAKPADIAWVHFTAGVARGKPRMAMPAGGHVPITWLNACNASMPRSSQAVNGDHGLGAVLQLRPLLTSSSVNLDLRRGAARRPGLQ